MLYEVTCENTFFGGKVYLHFFDLFDNEVESALKALRDWGYITPTDSEIVRVVDDLKEMSAYEMAWPFPTVTIMAYA